MNILLWLQIQWVDLRLQHVTRTIIRTGYDTNFRNPDPRLKPYFQRQRELARKKYLLIKRYEQRRE